MKKMKKAIAGALLLAASAQAAPVDVHGTGNKFIKVSEDATKTRVKFELCLNYQPNMCNPIGRKKFYEKSALVELRDSEKWDVVTSSVADVGIVVAAVFAGWNAGAIVALGGGPVWAVEAGAVAGGGTGAGVSVAVDALNPYEQYKQLETLQAEVLDDHTVFVPYSSEAFAKRLGTVLDNLDN